MNNIVNTEENKDTPYPVSDALAEASPQSLLELLSKDPFKHTEQDRAKVVAALREQRAKWEKAQGEGTKPPKAVKSKAIDRLSAPIKSAEDLGL